MEVKVEADAKAMILTSAVDDEKILSSLSQRIQRQFPSLNAHRPRSDVLLTSLKNLPFPKLLPFFHVLAEVSGRNEVMLTLINFSGKRLNVTERIRIDDLSNDDELNPLDSELLVSLAADEIKLCRGLTDKSQQPTSLLSGHVGEERVARSAECDYAVNESEPGEGVLEAANGSAQCGMCHKADEKVTAVVKEEYPEVDEIGIDEFEVENDFKPSIKSESDGDEEAQDDDDDDDDDDHEFDVFTVAKTNHVKRRPGRPPKNGSKRQQRVKESPSTRLQCDACKKKYTSRGAFEKHVAHCGMPSSGGKERCDVCLRQFDSKKQLDRHVEFHRSKHPDLDKSVDCPECGEEVETKLRLNPHFQSRHDPNKGVCIECYEVMEIPNVRRHLYNKHFYSVKDRLCPTCGDSFSSPLKLRVHISSVHDSTGTSCVCEQCGKVFPHKIKLNHHIYHHHNTTRRYDCHSCDKVFFKPMNYYKHVKMHSTVKPFFCELCGYRAVRRDNVRQHIRKVHKVENCQDHVHKDGKLRYEAVERRKAMEHDVDDGDGGGGGGEGHHAARKRKFNYTIHDPNQPLPQQTTTVNLQQQQQHQLSQQEQLAPPHDTTQSQQHQVQLQQHPHPAAAAAVAAAAAAAAMQNYHHQLPQ